MERDGHGPSEGGKGGFSAGLRERNIYNVRVYMIADLEKGASTASFKKWKHDLELWSKRLGHLGPASRASSGIAAFTRTASSTQKLLTLSRG